MYFSGTSVALLSAQENLMTNSNQDKVNGHANSAVGKVKEAVGKVTGDSELKTEGQNQQIKGDAQKAVGSIKSVLEKGAHAAGDMVEKLAGKIDRLADKKTDKKP
jgi:uncharacterized protein YjbJ (UPF0337 family)